MESERDFRSQFPSLSQPISWRSWRPVALLALWLASMVAAVFTQPHRAGAVAMSSSNFPWVSANLFGLHFLVFGFVLACLRRKDPFELLRRPRFLLIMGCWALALAAAISSVGAIVVLSHTARLAARDAEAVAVVFGTVPVALGPATWLAIRDKRRRSGCQNAEG